MEGLLVPVGNHFFSTEALQRLSAEAVAEHPGATRILKGGIDHDGISTVLVIGSKDGRTKVSSSFAHDWTGDNRFGVSGSFAF